MLQLKKLAFALVFSTGLFIPGISLVVSRHAWFSLAVPIVGFFWVAGLSISRVVLLKIGFHTMLGGLLLIHIAAFLVSGYYLKKDGFRHTKTKNVILFPATIVIFFLIVISSHIHKAEWFGFAFYQIPTSSMEPTLNIGDVILVDTWAYSEKLPAERDIIVFKRTERSSVLVKRIKKIRRTTTGHEMYVLGDNTNNSYDSRQFGWVTTQHLIGKSQFVWFNLIHLFGSRNE
jgi:signal peptidase I